MPLIRRACKRRYISHGAAFPKARQSFNGTSNSCGCDNLRASLSCIFDEDIRYEDLRWITWARSSPTDVQPFGEDCFSSFAVCSASRALVAAAVFGPSDVIASAFRKPSQLGALVSSRHGSTVFVARNRSIAPLGTIMRLPMRTYSSRRHRISPLICPSDRPDLLTSCLMVWRRGDSSVIPHQPRSKYARQPKAYSPPYCSKRHIIPLGNALCIAA